MSSGYITFWAHRCIITNQGHSTKLQDWVLIWVSLCRLIDSITGHVRELGLQYPFPFQKVGREGCYHMAQSPHSLIIWFVFPSWPVPLLKLSADPLWVTSSAETQVWSEGPTVNNKDTAINQDILRFRSSLPGTWGKNQTKPLLYNTQQRKSVNIVPLRKYFQVLILHLIQPEMIFHVYWKKKWPSLQTVGHWDGRTLIHWESSVEKTPRNFGVCLRRYGCRIQP